MADEEADAEKLPGSGSNHKLPSVSTQPITTPENEPVKPTPSIQPKGASQATQRAFKSRFDDWWLWELIGVVGSALCIVGLCVLLVCIQNKPVPRWAITPQGAKFSISINSIIGWFSTFGKILLLIPVTKGLGQLKWVWFSEQDRVLTDFDTFESATRGLTGSAFLVWRFKGRNFAVLGALAMILSLAFDPLIQNLVHYPIKGWSTNDTADAPAWIGRTRDFVIIDERVDPRMGSLDLHTKGSIMKAIYDTGETSKYIADWRIPIYYCSTNQCRWRPTPSVAIVSHCTDITAKLTKNCTYDPLRDKDSADPGCDYVLENGFSLGGMNRSRTRLGTITTLANSSFSPIVYKNGGPNIAIIQSIVANVSEWDWTEHKLHVNKAVPMVASECILAPTVFVFEASINYTKHANGGQSDGKWHEIGYRTNASTSLTESGDVLLKPKRNDTAGIGENDVFSMGADTYRAFRNYFSWILPGAMESEDGEIPTFTSEHANVDVPMAILNNPWNCTLDGEIFHDIMACTTTSIMEGINTAIRSVPLYRNISESEDQNSEEPPSESDQEDEMRGNKTLLKPPADMVAYGTTVEDVPFVAVEWLWIFLPILLWSMSTTFIFGVMLRTRRAGVQTWRTNPLAVVFLDVGDQEREHVRAHELTEDGLYKRAEHLRVKLKVEDREAVLVRPAGQQ